MIKAGGLVIWLGSRCHPDRCCCRVFPSQQRCKCGSIVTMQHRLGKHKYKVKYTQCLFWPEVQIIGSPLPVKSFHQRTGSCSENFPQSACRNNLRTVLHRTDLFTPEPPIKTSELSQFTRNTVLQRCILTVAGQQEEVCRVTKH